MEIVQQSYIFIPIEIPDDNTLLLPVMFYLNKVFNLMLLKENDGFCQQVYKIPEANPLDVTMFLYEQSGNTYLKLYCFDVNTITEQCAETFAQIHQKMIDSGVQKQYAMINPHDVASQYYCNLIYPKLNAMERDLRALLYDVMVLNLGRNYFSDTTSEKLVADMKAAVHAKNNSKRSRVHLEEMFYSLDYEKMYDFLFDPAWTEYDEKQREEYLSENPDILKAYDKEKYEVLSNSTPRTNWSRFFNDEYDDFNEEEVKTLFRDIQKYRNSIAHSKHFSKEDYYSCLEKIDSFSEMINSLLLYTEFEDIQGKQFGEIALTEQARFIHELVQKHDNDYIDLIEMGAKPENYHGTEVDYIHEHTGLPYTVIAKALDTFTEWYFTFEDPI